MSSSAETNNVFAKKKKKKQSYSLSVQPKFVRFESFTLRAVTKRDKTKEIKLAVILCRWSVVPSGTVPLD